MTRRPFMSESRRIVVVQYLRGIASLAVAWFHLTNSYGADGIGPVGFYGWLGVDVFFVISGLVIPYSLWNSEVPYRVQGFTKFLSRRVVRLEPPYLASIVLVIALWYLSAAAPGFRGTHPSQDSYQVMFHLFYLIPLTRYEWLQPVYWSLAYEFAFYIAVGLAYPILTEKNHIGIWLFSSIGLSAAVMLGFLPDPILLFVIGISLFRNIAALEHPGVSILIASLAATAIALSGSPQVALVGLLTAAAIKVGRWVELRDFLGKLLFFLGTISYSLYLTHVPIGGRVVNLGSRFIDGKFEQFFLSVLALATSIAFAWIFYVVIERRSLEISRHLFRKPQISKVAAQ